MKSFNNYMFEQKPVLERGTAGMLNVMVRQCYSSVKDASDYYHENIAAIALAEKDKDTKAAVDALEDALATCFKSASEAKTNAAILYKAATTNVQ